jgi:hypothetical protein
MEAGTGTDEEDSFPCHAVSIVTRCVCSLVLHLQQRLANFSNTIGLLSFGFMALEKLFPDLREECQKADI